MSGLRACNAYADLTVAGRVVRSANWATLFFVRRYGASTLSTSPPRRLSPRRHNIQIAADTAASADSHTFRSISWPSCESTTISVLSCFFRRGMVSTRRPRRLTQEGAHPLPYRCMSLLPLRSRAVGSGLAPPSGARPSVAHQPKEVAACEVPRRYNAEKEPEMGGCRHLFHLAETLANKSAISAKRLILLVGATGIEPATPPV